MTHLYHVPISEGLGYCASQVGYFHGYIDGVDYVFVDHPAFHAVEGAIYSGDPQAITWRCALLCKVRRTFSEFL